MRLGYWIIFAALMVLLTGPVRSETRLPPLNVVQSGHSLTDGIIIPLGDMVRAASMRGGSLDKATAPGSPMDWRWANETLPDIRQPQVMARYDVLVLTERVPLSNTVQWHASDDWALHWFEHAWRHGARTVLYSTWVDVDSGPDFDNKWNDPEAHLPFRQRLILEEARWKDILRHVNTNRPDGAPEMTIIPGPAIMAQAYDDVSAGRAPGISRIEALFEDSIHLNPMGNYLIALAHFAVVYGGDPTALPTSLAARSGLSKAQARWMQELVADVLAVR